MKKNRGFIFTLDTLLAVMILITFLMSFSFFSSQTIETPHPLLLLNKQGDDLLLVLDKTGKLGSLDAEEVSESIDETLPEHFSWNMQIEYYNPSGNLQKSGNFSFGSDYGNVKSMVVVDRMFLAFGNKTGNESEYYGNARLRLWKE